MIQEIKNYKNILAGLEEQINKSPYKKGYIIDKIGMSSPTFYRKLKSLSFTPDELMGIAVLLNPKEALLDEIRMAEKQYDEGKVADHSEIMDKLRKEFN